MTSEVVPLITLSAVVRYTAIKEILLAVEESKIALTPDGIQLQVGESTVIRLSKDGITIVGGSVFIN
ncbi:type VI secretion protein [Escherichia coli]|nr:type VI secretion protein [Escherichia coli]EEW1989957.1 type VI secretion protein [Escherichia coli]EEW2142567.1 type VI secretion protein [Escherichia coli]EFB1552794.1 type VI secretion protein [Escherichia coli]EFD0496821.1 type VI secretion protein [Escherichia coli]